MMRRPCQRAPGTIELESLQLSKMRVFGGPYRTKDRGLEHFTTGIRMSLKPLIAMSATP